MYKITKLHCYRGGPDDGKKMIACDGGGIWFHVKRKGCAITVQKASRAREPVVI